MVLKLINTAPTAGPKTKPEEYSTPAAKGIATTLYPVAQILNHFVIGRFSE